MATSNLPHQSSESELVSAIEQMLNDGGEAAEPACSLSLDNQIEMYRLLWKLLEVCKYAPAGQSVVYQIFSVLNLTDDALVLAR